MTHRRVKTDLQNFLNPCRKISSSRVFPLGRYSVPQRTERESTHKILHWIHKLFVYIRLSECQSENLRFNSSIFPLKYCGEKSFIIFLGFD